MSNNRPRLSQFFRRNRSRRYGATAVEFALTAPIFLLFLVASLEFGRFNVIRHTADNAAYEAARHAMVPGATSAEAVDKANSILRIVGARGATVSVSPATITADTDQVTVTIDVPMDQNGWITPHFTAAKSLHSTSTLGTERTGG